MLTVVGMGPAGLQWLTPAAREAIAAAEAKCSPKNGVNDTSTPAKTPRAIRCG